MVKNVLSSGNGLLSSRVITTSGSEEIISPFMISFPSKVILRDGLSESLIT